MLGRKKRPYAAKQEERFQMMYKEGENQRSSDRKMGEAGGGQAMPGMKRNTRLL